MLSKIESLPLEGKVGCEATRMRWNCREQPLGCSVNKLKRFVGNRQTLQHLTTAYGGASPQGEAFDKLHLKLMPRNIKTVEFC